MIQLPQVPKGYQPPKINMEAIEEANKAITEGLIERSRIEKRNYRLAAFSFLVGFIALLLAGHQTWKEYDKATNEEARLLQLENEIKELKAEIQYSKSLRDSL